MESRLELKNLNYRKVQADQTAIAKYIENQIEEDKIAEQISMKEYTDPFTGESAE